MRRENYLRLGLPLLLVLGTAGLGLSSATAVPVVPPSVPAASPGLVSALQQEFGLTEAAALTRIENESAAGALAPAAEKAAGKTFGGAWYDARKGTLVVGLTDDEKAASVRATGADTVIVANDAARLDSVKDRIDARSRAEKAPAGVSSWHVDAESSSVVVNVRTGSEKNPAVRAFVAAAKQDGPVTVRKAPAEAPSTFSAGVVGGDPYIINGNTRCSIGFAVQGGFVTAGHCGRTGSSVVGWDGSSMGAFAGSSFPGNDYAFVRIGNGWWTVPVVLGWGTVSDVLVRGSNEAPVGASICRSGSTTHWHCGTVLAKNETVNYSQGAFHQATKTSVCAEPGDSGGSFISGDQAQGVTSGGTGNCRGGGQTWYQPVNEILSVYGLTLVTA